MSINIEQIVDGYYEKHLIEFQKRNTVGRYSKNPKIEKALVREYDNRLSTFLQDSLFLYDLDYNVQLIDVKAPSINEKRVPQYFRLNKEQLLSYLGFRTSLRHNICPKVQFTQFYIIYITEILNGLYSKDLDEIFYLLVNLNTLAKNSKKMNSIFKSAFEALYLKGHEHFDLEIYKSSCKFKLFENSDISDELNFDYYFQVISTKSKFSIKPALKYIISKGFDYIVTNLEKKDYRIGGFKDVPISTVLNPVEADYYLDKWDYFFCSFFSRNDFYFSLSPSKSIYSKNGLLFEKVKEFDEFQKRGIYTFLKELVECFNTCCMGDSTKNRTDTGSRNTYFERYYQEKEKYKNIMNDEINSFLDEYPYYKHANKMSLEQLISYEKASNFTVNIDKAKKIKKQSVDIQDKLIIDDDEEDLIQVQEIKKNEVPNNDNPFIAFAESLSENEKKIVKVIMEEKENIPLYCRNNKLNYLIIIDSINEKANEHIQDIIIEDDKIIEDYLMDLRTVL